MDRPRLKKKEEVVKEDTRPLHVAYRPSELSGVVGHYEIVKSLDKVLNGKSPPHAYLFTGPSGIGKTTLARIVCRTLGIEDTSVLEVDAATYSAVDMVRQITQLVAYPSLGGKNSLRGVIVDECQAISKASWQVLLKPIEEPPPFVFWIFCTTEEDKVPTTIRTRCHSYTLRRVDENDLSEYLATIAELEDYSITEEALGAIVDKADGSPRQALQFLSVCRDCKTRKSALSLIDKVSESTPVVTLARTLASGRGVNWRSIQPQLVALQGEEPEGVRLAVVGYLTAVLTSCKDERKAAYLLQTLSHFETPFPSNMKLASLFLAVGKCIFSGDQDG